MMPIAVKGHMPFCPNHHPSSNPISIPQKRRDCRSKTNSLPILGREKASPPNSNSKSAPHLDSDEDLSQKDPSIIKSLIGFFKKKKRKEKRNNDVLDGKLTRAEFEALVHTTVNGASTSVHKDTAAGDDATGSSSTKHRSNSLSTTNSPYRVRLAAIREEDERSAMPNSNKHARRKHPNSNLKPRPASDPFDRKSKTYAQYLGISDSESSCDSIKDALQV